MKNMRPLDFIIHRQAGLLNKGLINRGNSQLNTDFIIRRFTCANSNSYVVPGALCDVPPFACKFAKGRNELAVATEEGEILLLNGASSSQDNLLLTKWSAHNNAIFDICWVPDTTHLLSGSGDHTIALHDVMTHKKLSTFLKHSGTIKSLDSCSTQPALFASGSKDGSVIVWDMRVGSICSAGHHDRPEIVINDAHFRNTCGDCQPSQYSKKKKAPASCSQLRSVIAVAFQDECNIASAGASDATVKIWDLRKTYIVNNKTFPVPKQSFQLGQKNLQHGCTSIRFDSTRNYLFACCTDHTISRFDCHSPSANPISRYHGFKASTYYVKLCLSPDDQYILCGSGDEKAHIWKVAQPGLPLVNLSGHSAEVTAVEWHPTDLSKLATCGDDNCVFLWNMVGHDRDLDDMDFIGTTTSHIVETRKRDASAECSSPTTSNSPSSSPLVKLRTRSLREFFTRSSPPSTSKNAKGIQNNSGLQKSPNTAVLHSLTNVLNSPNRKRKLTENETYGSLIKGVNENQLFKESAEALSASSLMDSFESESNVDKENHGSHPPVSKGTPTRSPLAPKNMFSPKSRENGSVSKKRSSSTPRSAKKLSPKGGRRETKLITNYFRVTDAINDDKQ